MAITGTLPGSWSQFKNASQGPWLMPNGSLYALTGDGVHKSTDNGATWSVAQSHGSTETIVGAVSGTMIHFVRATSSDSVSYHRFDTATDASGGGVLIINSAGAGAAGSTGHVHLAIAARSNGDVAILYQGAEEKIMGGNWRRVSVATYIGGTWTVAATTIGMGVQANNDAYAAVLGADDRIHLFYVQSTSTAVPYLRQETLTAANTFAGNMTVSTQLERDNYNVGLPHSDGTNIMVPYVDWTTLDLHIAIAASADSPTWNDDIVVSDSGNGPEATSSNPAAIVHDGASWHVVWINSNRTDVIHDQSADGATWGVDSFLTNWGLTGSSINGISANWIAVGAGGIGLLVSGDNGTVNYYGPDAAAPGEPVTINTTATAVGTSTATVRPSVEGYVKAILDTPGLQAYWRFGETAGTTVEDASGNGITGTRHGATPGEPGLLTGDPDTAYKFDAVDDYVSFGDVLNVTGTNPFSWEIWFRMEVAPTGWPRLFNKVTEDANGNQGVALVLSSDQYLTFDRFVDGTLSQAGHYVPIELNTDHYVAATYDGATMRLYLNAVEVASVATTDAMPTIAADLVIGALSTGDAEFFGGTADEPAVYNIAISPETIQEHYVAGTTAPSTVAETSASATGASTATATAELVVALAVASTSASVAGTSTAAATAGTTVGASAAVTGDAVASASTVTIASTGAVAAGTSTATASATVETTVIAETAASATGASTASAAAETTVGVALAAAGTSDAVASASTIEIASTGASAVGTSTAGATAETVAVAETAASVAGSADVALAPSLTVRTEAQAVADSHASVAPVATTRTAASAAGDATASASAETVVISETSASAVGSATASAGSAITSLPSLATAGSSTAAASVALTVDVALPAPGTSTATASADSGASIEATAEAHGTSTATAGVHTTLSTGATLAGESSADAQGEITATVAAEAPGIGEAEATAATTVATSASATGDSTATAIADSGAATEATAEAHGTSTAGLSAHVTMATGATFVGESSAGAQGEITATVAAEAPGTSEAEATAATTVATSASAPGTSTAAASATREGVATTSGSAHGSSTAGASAQSVVRTTGAAQGTSDAEVGSVLISLVSAMLSGSSTASIEIATPVQVWLGDATRIHRESAVRTTRQQRDHRVAAARAVRDAPIAVARNARPPAVRATREARDAPVVVTRTHRDSPVAVGRIHRASPVSASRE